VSPTTSSSGLIRLARRVARPLTSPLDGRVADINRRIAANRDDGNRLAGRVSELEGAVGSFAEASTEATSYVGIELGRISGLIDGLDRDLRQLGESAHEEYYRRRLSDATGLSLDQLDWELASLVNHAVGHRGFAAQADLWFNPPVTVELSPGEAKLASANERIAEVPFALMALGRVAVGARILDVGSAESTFPLSAASLGYRVTAVDPRGLPYAHPNLETVAGRFEDLAVEDGAFAAVFLISTVEHVGLPAYGITPHGDVHPGLGADRDLLGRTRELLAEDGFVAITTPYGRRNVNDFERTYDDEALDRLLEGWEVIDRRIVVRSDAVTWEQTEAPTEGRPGVAMLVARPASS
jgi:hypothetical protein